MRNRSFCIRNFCLIFVVILSVFLIHSHVSIAYEKEISSLSSAMAEKIVATGKKRVAVVDFTDLQGNVTKFGRFIAEEFSVALASAGTGFRVVDRGHLRSILDEHELSQTGLIDPETAKELGKITGVEALITGTATPFGESVRLAVKILDTTTAEVIDAQRGNIAKTQAITELLAGIATGGLGTPGRTTTPGTRTTPPTAKTQPATDQQSVQVEGFTFALRECKKSGETVTCHLMITSNNEDKELSIVGSKGGYTSRIFDNLGNEVRTDQVRLGEESNNNWRGWATNLLVAGITTKASLSFKGVSPQAISIELLEVNCNKFKAQFRNILLSE